MKLDCAEKLIMLSVFLFFWSIKIYLEVLKIEMNQEWQIHSVLSYDISPGSLSDMAGSFWHVSMASCQTS